MKSNDPALDIHPSPEGTITVILTLMRLLKRESPAQTFHVGSADGSRLVGKLYGNFLHINLKMAARETRNFGAAGKTPHLRAERKMKRFTRHGKAARSTRHCLTRYTRHWKAARSTRHRTRHWKVARSTRHCTRHYKAPRSTRHGLTRHCFTRHCKAARNTRHILVLTPST